jgi:hypothetical protein
MTVAEREAQRAKRREAEYLRRRTDREWAERERQTARRLYHQNPEYRHRSRVYSKTYYATYGEAQRMRANERYRNDPEYRERKKAAAAARAEAIRADPILLAREREARRFAAERKRRERGQKMRPQEFFDRRDDVVGLLPRTVPFAPFRDWLIAKRELVGNEQLARIADRAGSDIRVVKAIVSGERTNIGLGLVDRYLVAADEPPSLLDELYPLGEMAVAA